jgi:PST family polysaccharide transporter
LLRIKVAAVLLGPSGVGLIGLLQSVMATASSIAGLGFGNVGTRQIAEATGRADLQAVAAARRALFWGTLGLALAGAAVFWLLRDVLAVQVIGDGVPVTQVGWLALGVALTVAASSQGALLNGLRRIGDIARVSVLSAVLSTALGVGVLLWLGQGGVWAFVLASPLCSFLVGHWYVARLPKVCSSATSWRVLVAQWRILARLGAAFMLAGLVATLVQLFVRTLVQRQLGAESLGNFQASWQISMTYLGFVLAAMGTDYYPRLTATIHDHTATNRMVNEQTEVALLLGGSVLLAMLGLAPWVIKLLYSSHFYDAAGILRWQILGDVLKIVSWPLGFILLAAGDGRTFLITESIGYSVFLVLNWFGLFWFGVDATGIAFLGMYMVYLPLVYWSARIRTGFSWTLGNWWLIGLIFGACVIIKVVTIWYPIIGAVSGVFVSFCWAVYAMVRLSRMSAIGWPIPRICARIFQFVKF